MNNSTRYFSFVAGLLVLFGIYHLPEFFSAFWIMAVCKIGFIVVAYVIARLQGWKGFEGFGLGLSAGWWKHLLIGLLIGLAGFMCSVFISSGLHYERIVSLPSLSLVLEQLPMLLLMTSIPSIAEDILTRGYLFGHLGKRVTAYAWILISASFFVLNHIWRLDDGFAVIAYLFFLGLLLAYTVCATRLLWLAFGIHWGANIAYETTHAFVESTPLVEHDGSTWILAAIWAAVLLIAILIDRIYRRGILPGGV